MDIIGLPRGRRSGGLGARWSGLSRRPLACRRRSSSQAGMTLMGNRVVSQDRGEAGAARPSSTLCGRLCPRVGPSKPRPSLSKVSLSLSLEFVHGIQQLPCLREQVGLATPLQMSDEKFLALDPSKPFLDMPSQHSGVGFCHALDMAVASGGCIHFLAHRPQPVGRQQREPAPSHQQRAMS